MYLKVLLLIYITIVFNACSGGGNGATNASSPLNNTVIPTATTILTSVQISDLEYMYQEEKLARDVYNKIYEQWGHSTFSNIAVSEQQHMDSVVAILNKYSIPLPVSDDPGIYADSSLQSLYNTLIIRSNTSLNEAFAVGILIEETDIADLQSRIFNAPQDIASVYQQLLNGSYNHLASFNAWYNP